MYTMQEDVFKRPIGVIISQREMDALKRIKTHNERLAKLRTPKTDLRTSTQISKIQCDSCIVRFMYTYAIRKGD